MTASIMPRVWGYVNPYGDVAVLVRLRLREGGINAERHKVIFLKYKAESKAVLPEEARWQVVLVLAACLH